MPYFDEPVRWVKIQTTSKNTHQLQYFTPKTSNKFCYPTFFCEVFLFISHKAGKTKRIEKRSRPLNRFFLTEKNNQLYNIAVYMWYIYSRYLNSTLCSWIINLNYLVVTFTNAAPQIP